MNDKFLKSDIFVYFVLGSFGFFILLTFVLLMFPASPKKHKSDSAGASLDANESENMDGGSRDSNQGPVNRIIENNEDTVATVRYVSGQFVPKQITIKKEPSECVLAIVNESDSPLTIRLSPHSAKDTNGFLYPDIPPHESSLIDPRYRIPSIAFHNHKNPTEEFSVILGKGCEL